MDKNTLLRQARRNPRQLRFADLCLLAEAHGFSAVAGGNGHVAYAHPSSESLLTVQDDGGRARACQVNLVIAAIDSLNQKTDL